MLDKPIRILQMIGGLEAGGSQSMIINLYRNIDRTKVQFDFILDNKNALYYKEAVESLGAKIFFMPKFKGLNICEIKKAWNSFFREHPEYKVLHSHVRSYASIYIPIAKKHGLKTIIHSHSTSNGKGFASFGKAILQYPLRFRADYLFSCSRKAGEWLFGKRATTKNNYKIIPNAIDVEKYRFDSQIREKYRTDLNVSDNFVFIHVGRFHPAKNHLFLLDIFKGLKERKDNAKLVLVGDGELRDKTEEKIKQLKLENDVLLLGARSDVPELLQVADCFLFPSLWEGLPVTVVEAQAAGLPCFVSDKITKEVMISEAVKALPIDKGAEVWVDAISQINTVRYDVIEKIKASGFDITDSAKELTEFYLRLANE